MGVGTSHLQSDEASALLSFSSETVWPYDSERWLTLLHYKIPLQTVPAKTLYTDLGDYSARLVRNDLKSHNLVTLAAHVASRLPRVWYFSSTDIELTINAVVLMRVFFQSLVASCNSWSDVAAHLEVKPTAGKTRDAWLDDLTFDGFITSIIDFMAHVDKKLTQDMYELHVQVLTLAIALLSSQLRRREIVNGYPVVMGAASLATPDPALTSFMTAGTTYLTRGNSGPKRANPNTPASKEPRSLALLWSLLQNIAVDGSRSEDGPEPQPNESCAAYTASLRVVEERRRAVELWQSQQTQHVDGSGFGSGLMGKMVDTAIGGMTSAAAKVVGLPGTIISTVFLGGKEPVSRPLAERSAILLLLLVHNCRSGVDPSHIALANPYRAALQGLADSGAAPGGPSPAATTLSANFRQIFTALTNMCEYPLGTAMLYTLLQGSRNFAAHVLSRADIDELLLPVLHQIYHVQTLASDQRYILLVALLLFTQDPPFCVNAHRRITLNKIPWYNDRILGSISLGSFIILILCRVILNTGPGTTSSPGTAASAPPVSTGDAYLHNNCFAALANMAPYMERIHPYAAQRLVMVFGTFLRRFKRIDAKRKQLAGVATPSRGAQPDVADPSFAFLGVRSGESVPAAMARLEGLQAHYEQGIKIMCEVVYACSAPAMLASNVHLLYALLLDQPLSATLESLTVEQTGSASRGILDVIAHFRGVLDAASQAKPQPVPTVDPAGTSAVAPQSAGKVPVEFAAGAPPSGPVIVWEENDVIGILVAATRSWKGGQGATDQAAHLIETKFAYEEDANPELFFAPYIWVLATSYTTDCIWDPATIRLYTTTGPTLFITTQATAAVAPTNVVVNGSS